jgi:lipopolysaccharide/colanic/teichoic acid biosynthesis glycosyltransferase
LIAFRTAQGDGAFETRVGSFLRYTRIEHLPQLINVLRGEITLIGADRLPLFGL